MASQDELYIEMKIETEDEHLAEPLTERDARPARPNPEEKLIIDYKLELNKALAEKTNEIHEMLIIAKNIVEACKTETEYVNVNPQSHVLKLGEYTNQTNYHLKKIIRGARTGRISVKDVMADTKPIPPEVIPYIYSNIRDSFIGFYVKTKQIPTVTEFLRSLYYKRNNDFYKNRTIRTLIKNNLVKYHHLPKLNRFILTENPQFAYERHLYLRQIIGHRSRGKKIVYVTVLKVENTEKRPSFLALAANPIHGMIAKSDTISYAGARDEEHGNDEVKFWIRNMLTPRVSSSSVIVLMQLRKKDTTPTLFSTRQEMLDWLYKRDIPCDDNSHKAQLYNLVKIHKKKEPGFYEEVLKICGFNVLVCPIEYPTLNFFHDICENSKKTSASIIKMMPKLYQEAWTMMEEKIISEEKNMLQEDEEMGTIVENLLEMAKNGDLKAEDFPIGCSGTKADSFAVHVGDIVVD